MPFLLIAFFDARLEHSNARLRGSPARRAGVDDILVAVHSRTATQTSLAARDDAAIFVEISFEM